MDRLASFLDGKLNGKARPEFHFFRLLSSSHRRNRFIKKKKRSEIQEHRSLQHTTIDRDLIKDDDKFVEAGETE